jgi:hypothetical protein
MLPSEGAEHGVSSELLTGDPLQNHSCWSRKCPRVPRERSPSLGYVSNVPRVIPHSTALGRLLNPSGSQPTNP